MGLRSRVHPFTRFTKVRQFGGLKMRTQVAFSVASVRYATAATREMVAGFGLGI